MKNKKKMVKRSPEMVMVGYYLSRCGQSRSEKSTGPPAGLGVTSWKEAYDFFFEALGDGRTPSGFRNSLKHVRDAFDILFDNGRVGWKDKDGRLPTLSPRLRGVHKKWQGRSTEELETSVLGLRESLLSGDMDELVSPSQEARTEGGQKVFTLVRPERNRKLRETALALHGYDCMSCGFNFEEFYGEIGKGFIEVHHVVPLAKAGVRETDAENDLVVLCANCHRMVHRRQGICLSLNEIRSHIKR